MAHFLTGGRGSGHFAEEEWVDFVRGQGGEQDRARLARHLAQGCTPCGRALHLWKTLLGLTGREALYEPPAAAVREAKAQLPLRRPAGGASRVRRAASLVFEGFRHPLPAGVRAAGSAPLQVVYKAGHSRVTVLVEPDPGSDRLSVVGQIVDEANPERVLQGVGVLVLKAGEPVERTLTNRLGEFELGAEAAETLQISVGIPEMGVLTIPMPFEGEGASGRSARGSRGSGRKKKARHA